MNFEDEYIKMRKKESNLVIIKVAEKDDVKAFGVMCDFPFSIGSFQNREYRVSELMLRVLDKEGINYEVKK